MGGGALLPGVVELATEIFQLPTRIGYPVKLGGLVEEYMSPVYATAVGLVLYGTQGKGESVDISGREKRGGIFAKIKDWFGEFF